MNRNGKIFICIFWVADKTMELEDNSELWIMSNPIFHFFACLVGEKLEKSFGIPQLPIPNSHFLFLFSFDFASVKCTLFHNQKSKQNNTAKRTRFRFRFLPFSFNSQSNSYFLYPKKSWSFPSTVQRKAPETIPETQKIPNPKIQIIKKSIPRYKKTQRNDHNCNKPQRPPLKNKSCVYPQIIRLWEREKQRRRAWCGLIRLKLGGEEGDFGEKRMST